MKGWREIEPEGAEERGFRSWINDDLLSTLSWDKRGDVKWRTLWAEGYP